MKIRQGFVSNSSSSSFIILVDNKKPDGYFSIVDILKLISRQYYVSSIEGNKIDFVEKKGGDSKYWSIKTILEFLNDYEYDILLLLDFKKECEEKINAKKLVLDKDDETFKMIFNINAKYYENLTVEGMRENFKNDIENLEYKLKDNQKKIDEMNKNFEVVKKFEGKDYSIIKFKVDNWDIEKIVDLLKKSNAKIIERINT